MPSNIFMLPYKLLNEKDFEKPICNSCGKYKCVARINKAMHKEKERRRKNRGK